MGKYKVSIGGIDIHDHAPIRWFFVSGGKPATSRFYLTEENHQKLAKKDGNLTLSFEGPEPMSKPLKVKKVGIIQQHKAAGPNLVPYTIADRRFRLAGMPVDRLFNKIRRSNEKLVPGDFIDPNVAQFTAIPKRHFIPQFARSTENGPDDKNQKFAGYDDKFEPWTVLQAIKYLTSDEGYLKEVKDLQCITEFGGINDFTFGDVDFSDATESKILLKNWNPNSKWPAAIDYLLRQGHYMLFVDQDGKFVVRDLEPNDNQFLNEFGKYRGGGGLPIQEEVHWSAPKRGIVRFRKRYEIRFDYSEEKDFQGGNSTRGKNNVPLRLTPVFQMPQEVDTGITAFEAIAQGKKAQFQRGEYARQDEALDAWDKDVANNKPAGAAFGHPWNLERIRKYTLHNTLAHNYSVDYERPGLSNIILASRVAVVYQQFRRRFQIPRILLDIIELIDVNSVEIIDTASGRRQANNVIMDYLAWDAFLPHFKRGAGNKGDNGVRNYKAFGSDKDPSNFKFEDAEAAPAMVSIVDPVLGVIDINFVTDLSGMKVEYSPGLIDPKTIPFRQFNARNRKAFMRETSYSQQFRAAIKLSMMFRNNHEETKFLDFVEKNPAARNFLPIAPTGPTQVKYFRGFEAGYKWVHGQEMQIDGETNQVKFTGIKDGPLERGVGLTTGGHLVNESIIRDISEAEINVMYYDFRPRIVGAYAAQGWTENMPNGQVTNVEHVVGGGKRETIIRGQRPVPPPMVWEFFDPITRDFVGGFVEGSNLGAREG